MRASDFLKTYHCVVALVFDSIEPIDNIVRVLPLVCVCFGSYVVNDLLYYLFADLLNHPAPEEQPNISQAEVDLSISVEKPSKEEIKKAIRTLKNGKAAGPDGIPAEALKADIETATDILYNLFAKIWDEEKVPADWRKGLVIKLPKKGDLRD